MVSPDLHYEAFDATKTPNSKRMGSQVNSAVVCTALTVSEVYKNFTLRARN